MKLCKYEQLRYICPGNGVWGMVRIAMMIPESYELFISPAACGRHGALGAVQHGIKDRLSYYFVDEKDIIEGYDAAVMDAAGKLLACLETRGKKPRVLILFVTCIDDLIGTDNDAVAWELERRYPDTYFIFCHMNPITDDRPDSPMVSIHKSIYQLLGRLGDDTEDNGVNCIGNLAQFHPSCEFYQIAALLGLAPVRHIHACETFTAFEEMTKSCCSAVFFSTAMPAARLLETSCGQSAIPMYYSYDPDTIQETYCRFAEKTAELTGMPVPDTFYELIKSCRSRLKKKAEQVRQRLCGRPVGVDDFACASPFEVAKFLMDCGIFVKYIGYREAPSEEACVEELKEREPELEIISLLDYHLPGMTGRRELSAEADLICIGVDLAYVLRARYVADLFFDEGNYGFYGLEVVLDRLAAAAEQEADLQELIEKHGLVV